MKSTIAIFALLTISTTWAIKAKIEDPKGKRDASKDYSLSNHGQQNYQTQSLGQDEGNSISIGAGYSIGGQKPSYSFPQLQGQGAYQQQSEGLQEGGHQTYQLSPITLQSGHEGLVSSDLSQLMNQLSQGISSGAISIPSGGQGAIYQFEGQGHRGQGGIPQYTFGAPKFAQYTLGEQGNAAPASYATSSKGLGSYSGTGPVLFTPGSSNQQAFSFGAPSSGQAYESGSLSLGGAGHSFPGFSQGSSVPSLGGSYKPIKGNYVTSSKSSFKPSAFLGASIPSESAQSVSGSYQPSFANYQGQQNGLEGFSFSSGGHSGNLASLGGYGSSKLIAPQKIEGLGSLESIASAFSASGQLASPPGTTYGIPASSYPSNNLHSASVPSPQYYISPSKYSSSFGPGSSSYKGSSSGHSSLNAYSSGPKYSFGGHSSSYSSPKDAQGAYSETSYNTIKYSEELKPRMY